MSHKLMGVIDIHDDRFRAMVLDNAPLETLGEGYGWLEGPVWFADHQCLYVSDLPNDRVLRWTNDGGVSVFQQPSGFANGHARDPQGRLLTCHHHDRCISRTELDGTQTVLASHFEGNRLNSPNDIACRSDGTIFFSDPPFGINTDYEGGKQRAELPPTLYRLDPLGALAVAAEDFAGPNGTVFSPDERLLYVTETGEQFVADPRRVIRRFAVADDGGLSDAEDFHSVTPGYSDGLCVDESGNVWSSAGDGVHCLAPDGTLLGTIRTPARVSNLCFGGRYRARLFLCVSHRLMAIHTNVRGAVRP